jgi:hypothetical protein
MSSRSSAKGGDRDGDEGSSTLLLGCVPPGVGEFAIASAPQLESDLADALHTVVACRTPPSLSAQTLGGVIASLTCLPSFDKEAGFLPDIVLCPDGVNLVLLLDLDGPTLVRSPKGWPAPEGTVASLSHGY